MATPDDRPKDPDEELGSTLKQGVGPPRGNEQIEAEGYAAERTGEARQKTAQTV